MSPVKLTVLWQIVGGAELETALHRKFRTYRSHGEWFEFPDRDAPERVMRALSEIAVEAQEARRMRAARATRKARVKKALKAREVWTAPRGPQERKVHPGSRMAPHFVGEVVLIVREGWRYSPTAVIRFISPGAEYPIMATENDGRHHRYLVCLTEAEVAPQNAVPRRPMDIACRGTGCMCGNVD
jgi:hypothetical protein